MENEKTVHLILQGKGGVGKSFIATMLAQYIKEKTENYPTCIDTDPINNTLCAYKDFETFRLDIMEGEDINPRKFDNLIEIILDSKNDVIVDNGASSFVTFSSYILSNQIFDLLSNLGINVIVHAVIVGDQSMEHTTNFFVQMIKQFPDSVSFIVWLNHYFGIIYHNGKSFDDFAAYKNNKARIAGIVNVPIFKKETHGYDLAEILKKNEIFDDAIKNSDYGIVTRQRIKIVKQDIFSAISLAGL